ncbi:hypothetical protein BSKO_12208 [Bryopsis sp. KO-2023]|nr:hypothetical protein BSKO_12208 [Bryopsis sp. KO-2023]
MSARFLSVIQSVVDVRPDELATLWGAFSSFFLILFSYYLLVPLRDEAGVSLGTQWLPMLFLASLIVTLFAAPSTSKLLSRPGVSRETAIKQLYVAMGCILGAFYVLYLFSSLGMGIDPRSSVGSAFDGGNRMQDVDGGSLGVQPGHILTTSADRGVERGHLDPGSALSDKNMEGIAKTGGGADGKAKHDVKSGDARLSMSSRILRASFFLWIGVQNLVAMSAMWARCADVFSRDAAVRLYGFIGGGATLGQLLGSFTARCIAKSRQAQQKDDVDPPAVLILISAGAISLAAMASQRVRPVEPIQRTVPLNALPNHGETRTLVEHLKEGLGMIFSSAYLVHLCVYLMLAYCTASLFYFERSLVVSSNLGASNARTVWFATMNMYSGSIIACIQLTTTGRLLKFFGMPVSLAATPTLACLGLLAVFINPVPQSIMGAEVTRKVITYAIARPAREGLFTVVSTEEKYKAKICIDTIVQRVGDTLGAGAFQVIEGSFSLGPQGVAVMGMVVSGLWGAVAFSLGKRNQVLARVK